MEGPREAEDSRSSGHVARQLHCPLHRLRASVGEEKGIDAAGAHLSQLLRQSNDALVVENSSGMNEALQLLLGSPDHGRVVVPDIGDRRAASEVQILLPLFVGHHRSRSPYRNDLRVPAQSRGEYLLRTLDNAAHGPIPCDIEDSDASALRGEPARRSAGRAQVFPSPRLTH